MRHSRTASLLALLLLLASGYRTSLLRVLINHGRIGEEDPLNAGERHFLESLPGRVSSSSTVAFVFLPLRSWSDGYPYHFYRAAYAIAPREAIPAMGSGADEVWTNAARAGLIVCYPQQSVPEFVRVISRSDGALFAVRSSK